MGDRALIVFTDKDKKDFSPTVYLHWNGHDVPALLAELKRLMADRRGDVQYGCARFVGVCHQYIPGSHSVGIWNTSDDDKTRYLLRDDEISHGDAGVFVVNTTDYSYDHFGGYAPEPVDDENSTQEEAPELVYFGERRSAGNCIVSVGAGPDTPSPLDPRLDVINKSPTGFEWGYGGSGPAQLALAILLDFMGDERKTEVLAMFQAFKEEFICNIHSDEWEIKGSDIEAFIKRQPLAL